MVDQDAKKFSYAYICGSYTLASVVKNVQTYTESTANCKSFWWLTSCNKRTYFITHPEDATQDDIDKVAALEKHVECYMSKEFTYSYSRKFSISSLIRYGFGTYTKRTIRYIHNCKKLCWTRTHARLWSGGLVTLWARKKTFCTTVVNFGWHWFWVEVHLRWTETELESQSQF